MATVLIGDLFTSQAQTLVNTVNCVGVMGKGIALQFKERFPEMFADYQARCACGEVQLGKPYLFKRLLTPWVLNFPTKDHWRSVSRLTDIVRGLEYLTENYRGWGITSLAVPPLGCGYGGLEWRVVGPTMYRHLTRLDIPIELYAPAGTPEGELQTRFLADLPASITGFIPTDQPRRFSLPGSPWWRFSGALPKSPIIGRLAVPRFRSSPTLQPKPDCRPASSSTAEAMGRFQRMSSRW